MSYNIFVTLQLPILIRSIWATDLERFIQKQGTLTHFYISIQAIFHPKPVTWMQKFALTPKKSNS